MTSSAVCNIRHDGMIIMATNRPYDLDEAMHRRIMIAVEFRQPDHLLRKTIWESHMPEQMSLADDIDIVRLSSLTLNLIFIARGFSTGKLGTSI